MYPGFFPNKDKYSQFKRAILNYLNGSNDPEETSNELRLACTRNGGQASAKQFALNIELFEDSTHEKLDPEIIEILIHLGLPIDKKNYEHISSLYALLRQQKNIDFLLDSMDSSYPKTPFIYYVTPPLLFSIGLFGLAYIHPQFFWHILDWVIVTIPQIYQISMDYISHHLPLFAMAGQIILLIWAVYKTFEHGLDPSQDKIRELYYQALAITLTFIAHAISFAAVNFFIWMPALFLIAASLVPIYESYQIYTEQPKPSVHYLFENAHLHAAFERQQMTNNCNWQTALIRIIYALAIFSLVIFGTLSLPHPFLSITFLLTMWLGCLIKDFCIEHIKQQFTELQQKSIATIYQLPQYNEEKYIQKAKAEFLHYAKLQFSQIESPIIDKDYYLFMTDLILKKKPFRLETAKEKFNDMLTYVPALLAHQMKNSESEPQPLGSVRL